MELLQAWPVLAAPSPPLGSPAAGVLQVVVVLRAGEGDGDVAGAVFRAAGPASARAT